MYYIVFLLYYVYGRGIRILCDAAMSYYVARDSLSNCHYVIDILI